MCNSMTRKFLTMKYVMGPTSRSITKPARISTSGRLAGMEVRLPVQTPAPPSKPAYGSRTEAYRVCRQTTDLPFPIAFSNSQTDSPPVLNCLLRGLESLTSWSVPTRPAKRQSRPQPPGEDQKRFHDTHRFFSLADFGMQLAAHQDRSNDLPMRPLRWLFPKEKLTAFFHPLPVQHVWQTYIEEKPSWKLCKMKRTFLFARHPFYV